MAARLIATALFATGIMLGVDSAAAHPLGNFSVSHYSRILVGKDAVELKYIIDMAEIPTFQEIQEGGITPDANEPRVKAYLAHEADNLRGGLSLQASGRQLELEVDSTELIFPTGAGGLPTMKIAILFRAKLSAVALGGEQSLEYRDDNFPGRAGWKEIVAVSAPGVRFLGSSVSDVDQSSQLSDYPIDLLNSPPQQLAARIIFAAATAAPVDAAVADSAAHIETKVKTVQRSANSTMTHRTRSANSTSSWNRSGATDRSAQLSANKQATPRSSFTELMTAQQLDMRIIMIALAIAAGLGAFHALEPGHGKSLVAAYLVGSRGTFKHALLLGMIVTAAHTAGVYLLGAVTLYASNYIVPERLYPWLGATSGIMIAAVGLILLWRRYFDKDGLGTHGYHGHHLHHHHHDHEHHLHDHAHHHEPVQNVSPRQLLALGISGGIVPCPAALVVLLGAVSMQRIGFGLLLIVAFNVGLAAVLIAIGMLMVYARQFMSRFHGEGSVVTRWLPLASSAFIALFGIGLAWRGLVSAGFIRL